MTMEHVKESVITDEEKNDRKQLEELKQWCLDIQVSVLKSQSEFHRKTIARELLTGTANLPDHLVPSALDAIRQFPEFEQVQNELVNA